MSAPAVNVVLGQRAQFDPSTRHRRSMIAKINVARHQLKMVEDDYRQLLFDATGQTSLKECSETQLHRAIEALKKKGFQPTPPKGGKTTARSPMALKARAMWISLYQLGVVRNSSEQALEAFAKRQLGCEKLVWARQSEANRLIEALKAMAERAGWRQTKPNGGAMSPRELQVGLCERILFRLQELGEVPDDWTVETAAFRLCGIELVSPFLEATFQAEQYQRLAGGLGDKLRAAMPELATADVDREDGQ